MPIEIVCVRQGQKLAPLSEADVAELDRFPLRRALSVVVDAHAPQGLERWYRALCNYLAKGTGAFPDGDAVHRMLMLRSSKVESAYVDPAGHLAKATIVSTKYWGHAEWRAYVDYVVPIILAEMLPGVRSRDIRATIDRMVGVCFDDVRGAP